MANNILKSLNSEFSLKNTLEGKKNTIKVSKELKTKRLEKMKEYMEKQTTLRISFDLIGENGDLTYIDNNGITFLLTADSFRITFPEYRADMRSTMLGVPFDVRICDIKRDIVLLQCVKEKCTKTGTHRTEALERVLGYRVYHKKYAFVKGTVTDVTKNQIFVDIFDTGVKGVVPTMHFREIYTRDLRAFYKKGDIISGYVIKKRSRGEGEERNWIISMVELNPDPWENLPDTLTIGSVINIKCIAIPEGKSYFWGSSNVAKGIEIMCDFGSGKCKIEVGHTYRCKIKRLNPKKKIFQAVPFGDKAVGYLKNPVVVKNEEK